MFELIKVRLCVETNWGKLRSYLDSIYASVQSPLASYEKKKNSTQSGGEEHQICQMKDSVSIVFTAYTFLLFSSYYILHVFPGAQNPPANEGNTSSIPELGRSPGGGNGNPLQYSSLGNPIDRGAWRATVHGVTKSWTGPSD